jgi:hypothetical protein
MLAESDYRYVELLKAPKERKAKGVVISERASSYLEGDALFLQQTCDELPV